MSYVYMVDNTFRVTWLHYWAHDAIYISNSEILTVILCILLAFHGYARMRTYVAFRLYDREESEKRVAIRSASTDLLTLNTPHHAFRGSMSHCFTLAAIALDVMFEIRTPDKGNYYLIGIHLRLISTSSAFVLIANEVGLLECDRQQQKNPHINARYENLSDEDRWELWNYARIRL